MKVLVTGSSGLIGSECVRFFDQLGWDVVGADNNMRKYFFGDAGDTSWALELLRRDTTRFRHEPLDIRDRAKVVELFKTERFDAVIHCAAQPSHDWAKQEPFVDFEVNAVGTLNLLEANRLHSPDAPFVFMSTNKVYGDAPNEIALIETPTRWEYADPKYAHGIDESMRIDQSTHSLFGASKVAADILVQEYGRYFGMPTVSFRGGCLTGPMHSGAELHGFLSYLVKAAVQGIPYRVFGYKGKQVRDNIHSADVVSAFWAFIQAPRSGAVYNMGGERANSTSILEAIADLKERHDLTLQYTYVETNRVGDHICYMSDMRRFKNDYPGWSFTKPLGVTIDEIVVAARRAHGG